MYVFFRMTFIRNVYSFLLNILSVTFQACAEMLFLCSVLYLSSISIKIVDILKNIINNTPKNIYIIIDYFISKTTYTNFHCV
jgi:hypothetical protein